MPRLFTGIEIPSIQRAQLSLLQSGLKDIRWIDPTDFHITLRFIGDVSPQTGNDIIDTFSGQSWSGPTIELGELRAFGSSKPRSIYASVKESQTLVRLVNRQERLLQQLGLEPEHRQFTPHVTLARLRKNNGPKQIADYLSTRGGFSAPAFLAIRFVLYSARESTGGGPYKIEQSWTFKQ